MNQRTFSVLKSQRDQAHRLRRSAQRAGYLQHMRDFGSHRHPEDCGTAPKKHAAITTARPVKLIHRTRAEVSKVPAGFGRWLKDRFPGRKRFGV